jgi:hypothetical protein
MSCGAQSSVTFSLGTLSDETFTEAHLLQSRGLVTNKPDAAWSLFVLVRWGLGFFVSLIEGLTNASD